MYTVLLFYKYIQINDTSSIIKEQEMLCRKLGLLGRVIVSPEGINGTLSGLDDQCKAYIDQMRNNVLFKDLDFKINYSPFPCFSKLKIKLRKEIVMFHEHPIAQKACYNDQFYITADELHQALSDKQDNLVLIDVRNQYESRIGRFVNALIPPINNSREFHDYFYNNKDFFVDKDIVMYCSGGVRCERTSTALRSLGVCKRIRHLKNGIHAYIQKYPQGFFKGCYYVFDDRISIRVTDDILTSCDICYIPCDRYNNCLNALCNKHYISCDQCLNKTKGCCSKECIVKTEIGSVPLRPPLPSRMYDELSIYDVRFEEFSCQSCSIL